MAGPTAALAAVVGGGILGSLSAQLLARMGFEVNWYAPPEAPARADGAQARAYALSRQTVDLLQSLGIWKGLEGKTQAVTRMEVLQTEPSARVDLLASDAGEDWLAQMVVHADLLTAAEAAAGFTPGLHRLGGMEPTQPAPDESPRSLDRLLPKASLVIAADGAQSRLRRAVGLGQSLRHYEQKAVVMAFQTDEPHQGVACQWFRPEGILALLPLSHPHQVSMVYSLPTAAADKLLADQPEAIAQRITDDSGHRFGGLKPIDGAVFATPLLLTSSERFSLDRLFLVGDAAHTVHPLAGYGLNLGVLDLLDLQAQMKAVFGEGRPQPSQLANAVLMRDLANRYERSRQRQVPVVQWGLDGLQRLMMSQWPGLAQARGLGMRLIQGLPAVRGFLVGRALRGKITPF